MKLRLKNTFVESLSISAQEGLEKTEGLALQFGCAFSEQSDNTFQVIFEMQLNVEKAGAQTDIPSHLFDLKYVAVFELDDPITQEFIDGLFPKVNAPAIAYPYMRAFIGTTLLNAGFDPVMLPSVNFQALATSNNE
ncbi:protein-export chaperone SecB [Vibrio parahaemolyticus]|uniref:protein-export chaperone SecB n=1 Tax=Vibrio parahaemolyticus TaxID=670 RepID=UPI001B843F0C|nr:protein-export chaperone SecB [Vibrio parahaemolyticus]MDF5073875.1 protein-export chaperone SecB [Vibrio parahaemolyticus]MDF5410557.1 protein-export chaperone SecB [Vibrio parahaemolyticus]MDF5421020.1 protein-export chaperone SecB [Vibrio parahaemolyticus]HBC3859689.1 protein-export chaperone SecB [Vibrio parahaemolyticus]